MTARFDASMLLSVGCWLAFFVGFAHNDHLKDTNNTGLLLYYKGGRLKYTHRKPKRQKHTIGVAERCPNLRGNKCDAPRVIKPSLPLCFAHRVEKQRPSSMFCKVGGYNKSRDDGRIVVESTMVLGRLE